MNEIMLSVHPKWCGLIAIGKKTVEVRKTRPKIETPFKCYIYETKDSGKFDFVYDEDEYYFDPSLVKGKVIGEFTCDRIYELETQAPGGSYYVKGEDKPTTNDVARRSCLILKDMHEYLQSKVGYGWNISYLKIYDEPKRLSDFCVDDKEAITGCRHRFRCGQPESVTQHGGWIKGSYCCMKSGEPEWCEKCLKKPLVKPPQSWCYVERRD